MRNRSENSTLVGRRNTLVLAALVSSGLLFLMYALAGPTFAQDDSGGGGNGNITFGDCNQIQIIFINQFLNDGDDGGER